MIKWKAILIRLLFLGTVVGAIHFGSAPLARWIACSAVQMITGSRLEIEDLHASPFQTRMTAGNVRLGHPEKELENLFQFRNAEIKLDQGLLLRKKFIVTTGSVTGLEFGTSRDESGWLPTTPDDPTAPSNNYLQDI